MHLFRIFTIVAVVVAITGCATVRQQDLDSWVGMPVEALDTHSLFLTVPMFRTRTESGIEIRNYANGRDVTQCFGNAGANTFGNYVTANAFSTCSSGRIVCNNIFYIKDGKIIEYAPTGRCYTDASVQPQARYERIKSQ